MIALVVFTDGRDHLLDRTLASADENLGGLITRRVIHDDTASVQHGDELADRYPGCEILVESERRGFGGSIRAAWRHLAGTCAERFVFHLEDDFLFDAPVDLAAMATVLDRRPNIVQMALRRQAWNSAEKAAGGVVEQHPDSYRDVTDFDGYSWLEHRLFFTTNPSLYRRDLCSRSWPTGPNSEGRFTHQVLQDHDARFAYWGARNDPPAVTHIGEERVGVGY